MKFRVISAIAVALMLAPAGLAAVATLDPADVHVVLDEGGAPIDVRIVRDAYGVPHIYSDEAYGLFWGNGYAQAQDRLFQMDVLRHVGKGDSAAYLGPSQLPMDLETRRELYTDAERIERWDALSPEYRRMFQGFADGVNAFINETIADPTSLSAEFYAIAHAPEQWLAEDTIAVAEYLLDIFGAGSGGGEQRNARILFRLADELGWTGAEAAFNDFFPLYDTRSFVTVPEDEYTYDSTEAPLALDDIPPLQMEVAQAAAEAVPFAAGETLDHTAEGLLGDFKFGSNAAVFAPELAVSGNSLLLGGPQMAYYNPMVPYELGLHGAGFDAVGMGVGGAPGVIIGRNAEMAWTVTSGSSDQVDVVAVKLVDGDHRSYYVAGTSGATKAMECRTEVHYGPPTAIDQNPPVLATQEVCRTERGPVFAINEDMGYAFVRERTHRLDELRSGILWLTVAQNHNIEDFAAHMETFCFEFNFHIAANNGDIAYLHFGCNPDRADGYDPRLPRLAGEWDWEDVRTGSELPHITNPEQGYLVNWNNKPARGWSGGDAMEKWGANNRVALYDEAIQAALDKADATPGKLDVADLEAINVFISTRSPYADEWAAVIMPLLDDMQTDENGRDDARATSALAAWHAWEDADWGWDATAGVYDFSAFTIWQEFRGRLQPAMFADELAGDMRTMEFEPPASSDPHAADWGREDNKENVALDAIAGVSGHDWCDDATTATPENCATLLRAVMKDTLDALEAQYDSADASTWQMAEKHIKFVSLSGSPAWEIPMVNRPSFNHLYDWGTGHSASVMPPGSNQYWMPVDFIRFSADGTLPDAHKRDQLDLYTAFEYKPAYLEPVGVESDVTFQVATP